MKKKILSILLVTMLLLTACAGALAQQAPQPRRIAPSATGSITVNGVEAGAKISAYQIMNVDFRTDTQSLIGYSWVAPVDAWIKSQWAGYNGTAPTLPSGVSEKLFYDKMAAAISGKTLSLSAAPALTNLALGQYLVLVTGGVNVYEPMVGNVAPVWDTGTGEWNISSPTITAKASTPTLDKKINAGANPNEDLYDTVSIGEDVTFDIRANVPTYPDNATATRYDISDTMSKGLTYKDGFQVWGVDASNAETLLTAVTDYTLAPAPSASSQSFAVKLIYAQIKQYKSVHIKYVATVNAEAELGTETNKNTAKLTYSNDPYVDTDFKEITDEVKLYPYGVKVTKLDGKDNVTVLAGAEFELRTVAADAGTAIKFAAGTAPVYKKAVTGGDVKLVTSAAGLIQLDGLDVGTYYLVETKAPGGYNLLVTPVTVTIVKDSTNPALAAGQTDAFVKVTVANNKGPVLPSTGGMGTTLFTVLGIALMAGVVIVLIVMNRKKSKKAN
ncbi:MAG: SpaH/EbpB family LPXTG-anchored major pilin [Clostridia bacterium]